MYINTYFKKTLKKKQIYIYIHYKIIRKLDEEIVWATLKKVEIKDKELLW